MRLAPRDVRDHIVSRQNDHGPSYRRHGGSQRQRCLGIDFREIFGFVGFSTFATKSAITGPLLVHSITLSAIATSAGGTESPSCLAVLRLMDNSNLVTW